MLDPKKINIKKLLARKNLKNPHFIAGEAFLLFLLFATLFPNLFTRAISSVLITQNDWSVAEPGGMTTNLTSWNKYDSTSNIVYDTSDPNPANHGLKLAQTFEAWGAGGVRATESTTPSATPRSVASGAGIIVTFFDTSQDPQISLRAQRIRDGGERDPSWPPDGVQIDQSNTINTGQIPKIVSDGASGAIIVFEYNDTLYAQRVDFGGALQWGGGPPTPIQIAGGDCNNQDFDVVSDSAGGVIVVWSMDTEVHAQRVLANGSFPWNAGMGIQVKNASAANIITASDDSNGAYFSYDYQSRAYVNRINGNGDTPAGWPGEIQLDPTPPAINGSMVSDGNSGVVIAWQHILDGSFNSDIYMQRVAEDGSLLWNSGSPINITNTNPITPDQNGVMSLALLDGNSVGITWRWKLNGGDDSHRNIYLQKLNLSDGTKFSADWPAEGKALGDMGAKDGPVIAQDGASGAYVFWLELRGVASFIGQRIDSDGTPAEVWPEDSSGINFGVIDSQQGNSYFIEYNGSLFASSVKGNNGPTYVQNILNNPISYPSGFLTSSVFNAGEQKNWDSLGWTADIPAGSSISVEARTAVNDPNNIALASLGTTATATSYCGDGNVDCGSLVAPPANAIDSIAGSILNSWATINSDFVTNPQDLTIDFGQIKTVSRINLDSSTTEAGNAAPKDFTIDTSPNGSDWTTQTTITNNPNNAIF